jgi:hypothetical protein
MTLTPSRLMETADAALDACEEQARQGMAACIWPADLVGTTARPACLEGFEEWEIEEGAMFLMRLGLLQWEEE